MRTRNFFDPTLGRTLFHVKEIESNLEPGFQRWCRDEPGKKEYASGQIAVRLTLQDGSGQKEVCVVNLFDKYLRGNWERGVFSTPDEVGVIFEENPQIFSMITSKLTDEALEQIFQGQDPMSWEPKLLDRLVRWDLMEVDVPGTHGKTKVPAKIPLKVGDPIWARVEDGRQLRLYPSDIVEDDDLIQRELDRSPHTHYMKEREDQVHAQPLGKLGDTPKMQKLQQVFLPPGQETKVEKQA